MGERPAYKDILKDGVQAWNAWRARNPEIVPWLSGDDLAEVEL